MILFSLHLNTAYKDCFIAKFDNEYYASVRERGKKHEESQGVIQKNGFLFLTQNNKKYMCSFHKRAHPKRANVTLTNCAQTNRLHSQI